MLFSFKNFSKKKISAYFILNQGTIKKYYRQLKYSYFWLDLKAYTEGLANFKSSVFHPSLSLIFPTLKIIPHYLSTRYSCYSVENGCCHYVAIGII